MRNSTHVRDHTSDAGVRASRKITSGRENVVGDGNVAREEGFDTGAVRSAEPNPTTQMLGSMNQSRVTIATDGAATRYRGALGPESASSTAFISGSPR